MQTFTIRGERDGNEFKAEQKGSSARLAKVNFLEDIGVVDESDIDEYDEHADLDLEDLIYDSLRDSDEWEIHEVEQVA